MKADALKKFVPTVARWGKAVGSFALCQIDGASARYARHQARLASVEIWRDGLKGTHQALNNAKGKILEKLSSATDELERARVLHDLEFIDGRLNLSGVLQNSVAYLNEVSDEGEHGKQNRLVGYP